MIFYKYQGCGNDFIILDGRPSLTFLTEDDVKNLCDRRFGIGGDGLMILESSDSSDFKMIYYNSDGRKSSFCGNGGRCIVQFAHDMGIIENTANFIFDNQLYSAVLFEENISLKMQNVDEILVQAGDFILNTGSPHYIHFAEKINEIELIPYAHKIRYSEKYPEGVNVNLVEMISPDTLYMRTYERGVEDETYSCGTGVVAAALAFHHKEDSNLNEVSVRTKGGDFRVQFTEQESKYRDIYLLGPAKFVFKGEIDLKE